METSTSAFVLRLLLHQPQVNKLAGPPGEQVLETTLICNLMNLQQLLLPHTDSGETKAPGQSGVGVKILNISVGGCYWDREGGASQSVS